MEKAVLENQADFGIGFEFNRYDMLLVTKLYDEEFYLISNQSNGEPGCLLQMKLGIECEELTQSMSALHQIDLLAEVAGSGY
ncbi:hypothetical protein ACXM0N_19290 [Peribacillus simplex]